MSNLHSAYLTAATAAVLPLYVQAWRDASVAPEIGDIVPGGLLDRGRSCSGRPLERSTPRLR